MVMARPLRIEYPGAIYHVTFGGNERKPIFQSDTFRRQVLQQMTVAHDRYQA
jgi:putative transposase